MQDILTGGNFGRKNQARAAAGMMLDKPKAGSEKRGMIRSLWKTMLGGVRGYHYHALEKYPVLWPVFIVEFMVKRFWRVLTGKRSSVFESRKYVEERATVYDRLQVFKK